MIVELTASQVTPGGAVDGAGGGEELTVVVVRNFVNYQALVCMKPGWCMVSNLYLIP